MVTVSKHSMAESIVGACCNVSLEVVNGGIVLFGLECRLPLSELRRITADPYDCNKQQNQTHCRSHKSVCLCGIALFSWQRNGLGEKQADQQSADKSAQVGHVVNADYYEAIDQIDQREADDISQKTFYALRRQIELAEIKDRDQHAGNAEDRARCASAGPQWIPRQAQRRGAKGRKQVNDNGYDRPKKSLHQPAQVPQT